MSTLAFCRLLDPQQLVQALTVGVGTVMDAKEVLVLITGANKAIALYKVEKIQHFTFISSSGD